MKRQRHPLELFDAAGMWINHESSAAAAIMIQPESVSAHAMSSKTPGIVDPSRNPMVDDGDEVRFCSTCAFSNVCISAGYDKVALGELHVLVEHVGPFRAGERLFRTRDPFKAIYAVRGGLVKTVSVDVDGKEQVLGFYLPGEVIGLNGIYPEHYPCDAVVLETSYFCRFSFPAISALASRMPKLQQQLFRLLSKELALTSMLAGDHSAEVRMAAFLVDLSDRFGASGFSERHLVLNMSRIDIGNYLRLASETVSRLLTHMRERGLIRLEGRQLEILDGKALRMLARSAIEH